MTHEEGTIESIDIAAISAQIADEKKAEDIVILDLQGLTFITDYFVICTAFSGRQLQVIAEEIQKKMKELGVRKLGASGHGDARWILLDYGDAVIHLFDEDTRQTYDLELLWGDAPRVNWETTIPAPK